MSGFEGRMKEYRQISVDRFDQSNLTSTVFFLSHCHRDHMVGLDKASFLRCLMTRKDVFLYCSEVSKLLLLSEECFRPLAQYIRVLEIGVGMTVAIPNPDTKEFNSVMVTALPAGHCPGSVMFLFEGQEGRALYTGDFRWEKNYATTLPALCVNGHMKEIDSMYVDTTFCIPEAFHIPSRDDCLSATAALVVSWLKEDPSRFVHVSSKTKYGHEPLLVHLSREAKTKIHTSKEKADLYEKISELQDIFTQDGSARIHACYWQKDRDENSKLPCGYLPPNGSNASDSSSVDVMMIRPSTMWFTAEPSRLQELVVPPAYKHGLYRVCYSFHSSYSEVRELVSLLRPRNVYPNVLPATDREWIQVKERLEKFRTYKHKHHFNLAINNDTPVPLGLMKRKRTESHKSVTCSDDLIFDSPQKKKREEESTNVVVGHSSQKSDASILTSPAKSETHSSYHNSDVDEDMFANDSFEAEIAFEEKKEGERSKDLPIENDSLRSYVSGDEEASEEDYPSSPKIRHVKSNDDSVNRLQHCFEQVDSNNVQRKDGGDNNTGDKTQTCNKETAVHLSKIGVNLACELITQGKETKGQCLLISSAQDQTQNSKDSLNTVNCPSVVENAENRANDGAQLKCVKNNLEVCKSVSKNDGTITASSKRLVVNTDDSGTNSIALGPNKTCVESDNDKEGKKNDELSVNENIRENNYFDDELTKSREVFSTENVKSFSFASMLTNKTDITSLEDSKHRESKIGEPQQISSFSVNEKVEDTEKKGSQLLSSQDSENNLIISDSDSDLDCTIIKSFMEKSFSDSAKCFLRNRPGHLIGGFGMSPVHQVSTSLSGTPRIKRARDSSQHGFEGSQNPNENTKRAFVDSGSIYKTVSASPNNKDKCQFAACRENIKDKEDGNVHLVNLKKQTSGSSLESRSADGRSSVDYEDLDNELVDFQRNTETGGSIKNPKKAYDQRIYSVSQKPSSSSGEKDSSHRRENLLHAAEVILVDDDSSNDSLPLTKAAVPKNKPWSSQSSCHSKVTTADGNGAHKCWLTKRTSTLASSTNCFRQKGRLKSESTRAYSKKKKPRNQPRNGPTPINSRKRTMEATLTNQRGKIKPPLKRTGWAWDKQKYFGLGHALAKTGGKGQPENIKCPAGPGNHSDENKSDHENKRVDRVTVEIQGNVIKNGSSSGCQVNSLDTVKKKSLVMKTALCSGSKTFEAYKRKIAKVSNKLVDEKKQQEGDFIDLETEEEKMTAKGDKHENKVEGADMDLSEKPDSIVKTVNIKNTTGSEDKVAEEDDSDATVPPDSPREPGSPDTVPPDSPREPGSPVTVPSDSPREPGSPSSDSPREPGSPDSAILTPDSPRESGSRATVPPDSPREPGSPVTVPSDSPREPGSPCTDSPRESGSPDSAILPPDSPREPGSPDTMPPDSPREPGSPRTDSPREPGSPDTAPMHPCSPVAVDSSDSDGDPDCQITKSFFKTSKSVKVRWDGPGRFTTRMAKQDQTCSQASGFFRTQGIKSHKQLHPSRENDVLGSGPSQCASSNPRQNDHFGGTGQDRFKQLGSQAKQGFNVKGSKNVGNAEKSGLFIDLTEDD